MSIVSKLATMDLVAPAGAATPKAVAGSADGILIAYGTTVPTDAETGYATGCLFIHTDASSSGFVYINEGTVTSCDFNYVAAGT